MRNCSSIVACACAGLVFTTGAGAQQYAVEVVDYDPGANPTPGFTDENAALGAATRFTGTTSPFPSVVSPFSPPFGADELVSIGAGGSLTLRLGVPARNLASNPFGVDLIVFTNVGFADASFPDGVVSDPPFLFGADSAIVEVSADGDVFVSLGEIDFSRFPTAGYLDGGAFDSSPGAVKADIYRPVDPSLTVADFAGLDLAGVRALYDGSAGGTPIDIAPSGLSEVNYIRFSVPESALALGLNFEIDAVTVVPAPGGAVTLLAIVALAPRRRR